MAHTIEHRIADLENVMNHAADYTQLQELIEAHDGTQLELEIRIVDLQKLEARVVELEAQVETLDNIARRLFFSGLCDRPS